jgi:hypothetical protein
MAEWHFSDGSVLSSGGKVSGNGPAAVELRRALNSPWYRVQALPHPMDDSPLDPNSDFLLDVLADQVARDTRTTATTEYEFDYDDAPPELAKKLHETRRLSQWALYGLVH